MEKAMQMLPETLSRLSGETLAGAYRLDEVVGVGGMGVVFRGEQLNLGRAVAVKVLAPGDADNHAQRFEREAKSVARLDHRNCLQLYDYGTTDDALHYMVMPMLRGAPLDEVVGSGQTMAPRSVLRLLEQVLDGLAHAHGRGLIHRDLKPSNLLIEQRGDSFCEGDVVRIVDFGIAKIVDDEAAFQSRVGALAGTPAYMSPEQAMGETVDARCDLYAAGLIAYRLLVGTVPHRARCLVEQLQRRATLDVPRLPPALPEAVTRVVARLCVRRREDRFADANAARYAVLEALNAAPSDPTPAWDNAHVADPKSSTECAASSGGLPTERLSMAGDAGVTSNLSAATWSFDDRGDVERCAWRRLDPEEGPKGSPCAVPLAAPPSPLSAFAAMGFALLTAVWVLLRGA